MTTFKFDDTESKARIQTECDKRNKAILKSHPMRWKALFDHSLGWHCALRPAVDVQIKPKGKLA
jgi:hypothetical protein